MAGVNGDRKGKKDDNGLGTAIDFVLSNAKLVLGVGGAAMLGIATLAVKRVSTRTFENAHLYSKHPRLIEFYLCIRKMISPKQCSHCMMRLVCVRCMTEL